MAEEQSWPLTGSASIDGGNVTVTAEMMMRRRVIDLEARLAEAITAREEAEMWRNHWKANHAAQVRAKRGAHEWMVRFRKSARASNAIATAALDTLRTIAKGEAWENPPAYAQRFLDGLKEG